VGEGTREGVREAAGAGGSGGGSLGEGGAGRMAGGRWPSLFEKVLPSCPVILGVGARGWALHWVGGGDLSVVRHGIR